jgi:hypothetical protein
MDEQEKSGSDHDPEKSKLSAYKCSYGNKGCGVNARYCVPCNDDYAKFLELLRDDR